MHESAVLLTSLFSNILQSVRVEIQHLVGGKSQATLLSSSELAQWAPPTTDGNWYFGVLPRTSDGKGLADEGSTVWTDVDGGVADPKIFRPRPTIIVNSGHGTQAHWALNVPAPADVLLRLSRLAALAFGGDRQVLDARRLMRLPGTINNKSGKKPVPATLVDSCAVSYDPDDLSESLAAYVVSRVWADGGRHQMALALGAALSRIGWEEDDASRFTRQVCRFAGDTEIGDRLRAIEGTYARRAAGETVTSVALMEALNLLASKGFDELMGCLGVKFRDGDVMDLEGTLIGNMGSIQADLANYLITLGDYSYLDGQIVRWETNHWRVSTTQELLAYTFQTMEKLRVYEEGQDRPFLAQAKLAKDVRDVTFGRLSQLRLTELQDDMMPVANGILRLTDRVLLPYDRSWAVRWVAPVTYDTSATCPEWNQFIQEAAPGTERYLQEWFGYCLQDGNSWQRMLWLCGVSGAGKSTFLKTVAAVLGDAAVAVPANDVSDYAIASLAGRRLAVCAEIAPKMLKTQAMKSLAASDPIPARHPYGRPFTLVFTGKLLWTSNALPTPDEGEGVWRRIKVVRFDQVPAVSDPFLFEKITTPESLSGVLNWAIEGLDRVRGYRLTGVWQDPAEVTATVNEYADAANTFGRFVEEQLILDPAAECSANDLYRRYDTWMRSQGHTRIDPQGPGFWRRLREAGLVPMAPKRVNKQLVRMWQGAELTQETFV